MAEQLLRKLFFTANMQGSRQMAKTALFLSFFLFFDRSAFGQNFRLHDIKFPGSLKNGHEDSWVEKLGERMIQSLKETQGSTEGETTTRFLCLIAGYQLLTHYGPSILSGATGLAESAYNTLSNVWGGSGDSGSAGGYNSTTVSVTTTEPCYEDEKMLVPCP